MKAKNLSSAFRSVFRNKPSSSSSSSSAAASLSSSDDVATTLASVSVPEVSRQIEDILLSSPQTPGMQETDEAKTVEQDRKELWFLPDTGRKEKEISRDRKQIFMNNNSRFMMDLNILKLSAHRIGSGNVMVVHNRLGKYPRVKEFNALVKECIEKARVAPDEVVAENNIRSAIEIYKYMKELGIPFQMNTYAPIFEYLVDMGMTEEFFIFSRVVKKDDPSSLPKLGYYEMMLWIKLNDEEKIQELCNGIESCDGVNKSDLQENYLLALSQSDRTQEILQLLESMDITKLSSEKVVARIIKGLGRLLLESFAEKVLLEFKASDCEEGVTSNLICSYVVGIPNLAVEDVGFKLKKMHTKLEVTPSSASYEQLLIYCCDSLKVHVALELVDEMFEQGLKVSRGALHSILQASSESCDFNLVHQIYSVISRGNLKPTSDTFRSMISLCVKMKDYEGAYRMLNDLEKMNLKPTTAMYNAIMSGHFREKNRSCGLQVLKQMKEADVKPDSLTYSHLIINCTSEKEINKYYEEIKQSQIHITKHVFMALVNAYAACGQYEKAKQVLLDKGIPAKSFNEIKSVLVQAFASHGQLSDAFNTYEEIKKAGNSLEPKAVISLIEHLQSDEEALDRLLLLLETLDDPNYWLDGCLRTIFYCVRYKHLRPAVCLLEQVRDQVCTDELALEVIFDQVFSVVAESESSLQFGLDLLHAMKSELGLNPSRKCLDFLLHACVSAKDLQSSLFVWQEYQAAGLPYNVLSFLRMYQALLAAGDHKAAKVLKTKIPKDDPHVGRIIEACNATYPEKKISKKEKEEIKVELLKSTK